MERLSLDSLRFHRATRADLPSLLELERRSFDRPWPEGAFEQELSLRQAELWLVSQGDELVGYVDLWVVGDEVSLLNVAVDPAVRRQGLGVRLVDWVLQRAMELAGETVFLEVRRSNSAGLALYRKTGFEQIGIRKRYYSDTGEDAIVMSKRVDGKAEDG